MLELWWVENLIPMPDYGHYVQESEGKLFPRAPKNANFPDPHVYSCTIFIQYISKCIYFFERAVSKAGINVWASQKEKTNFGPVMSSYDVLVMKPLKILYKAYLWCQALEETCKSLILHHASNNLETTFGVLKITILDSSLDHVQRSGNNQWCGRTSNRSNEVLEPGCFVVIIQTEEISLRESRSTKKL